MEDYKMKHLKWMAAAAVAAALSMPLMAAEQADPAVGDWLLKADFDGRPMNAILIIAKDKDGKLTGLWGSFFGTDAVDNLKAADGKISFSQTIRFRPPGGGQDQSEGFTVDYSGTIKEGKMSLTASSDRGDFVYEGRRLDALPPVLGVWEFKRQRNEQEIITLLTVSQAADGTLTADWTGPANSQMQAESKISDVKFENGKLTFTRSLSFQDRQMETTYELTASGDTLSGVSKSQRGEREVTGRRLGSEHIGKWDLSVSSDFGQRRQLLIVLPDMTGMYGAVNVGKITFENGQVSFKYSMGFGDRTFESEFKGQLQDGKLTGQITTSRGTQQVEGKKMMPAA